MFLIIINDQYEVKSIDKLHYKIPAVLAHEEWHSQVLRMMQ